MTNIHISSPDHVLYLRGYCIQYNMLTRYILYLDLKYGYRSHQYSILTNTKYGFKIHLVLGLEIWLQSYQYNIWI